MKDVLIASLIYSLLFVVLTMTMTEPVAGLSMERSLQLHYLASEIIFWIATFYICASATFGAFARQDRFALSQNHPLLNRFLSLLLLAAPFLAILYEVRFVYILLGLLTLSHLRSKTNEEKQIEFSKSRAFSNILLMPLFTLALMLMNNNGYYVSSVLDLQSIGGAQESLYDQSKETQEDTANAEG